MPVEYSPLIQYMPHQEQERLKEYSQILSGLFEAREKLYAQKRRYRAQKQVFDRKLQDLSGFQVVSGGAGLLSGGVGSILLAVFEFTTTGGLLLGGAVVSGCWMMHARQEKARIQASQNKLIQELRNLDFQLIGNRREIQGHLFNSLRLVHRALCNLFVSHHLQRVPYAYVLSVYEGLILDYQKKVGKYLIEDILGERQVPDTFTMQDIHSIEGALNVRRPNVLASYQQRRQERRTIREDEPRDRLYYLSQAI